MTAIDEPGPESRQKVMLGMVRAISAAQQSVDVENAYFMEVPAVRDALTAAMKRGVCVRLLTNSTDTVDETVVCVPILKGLRGLLDAAEAPVTDPDLCQVYVRTRIHPGSRDGDTLHSKFVVVDRAFSVVASLNIHARSLRLERSRVRISSWIRGSAKRCRGNSTGISALRAVTARRATSNFQTIWCRGSCAASTCTRFCCECFVCPVMSSARGRRCLPAWSSGTSKGISRLGI